MTELSGKSYDELVWLVLEGTASDADRSELAARLKASGAVRRNYVEDMYFHAVLRGRLTGAAGLAKPRSAAPNSSLAQVRTRERHWRRASMVAGVLLGTCALLAGVAVSVSGIAGWSGKGAPSLEGEASLSSATGPASAAVASQTQTGASASPEKGQPSMETGKKEMMEMKSLTKALSAAGMVLAASASSATRR